MATVSSSSLCKDSEEKSDVAVVADRWPKQRRRPNRFCRALCKVSTARIRTWTENDSSSTTMTSAPLAFLPLARLKRSCASSR